MAGDQSEQFRGAFRGYNRGDVDTALARAAADREAQESQLDAALQRANAMQVEINELHARIEQLQQREESLRKSLEELHDRRDHREREAAARASAIVLEAEERASLLKTEGLRQVGELQRQVEQLIAMRAGLTAALRALSQDLAGAMAKLGSSAATGIDQPVEDHVERWSRETES